MSRFDSVQLDLRHVGASGSHLATDQLSQNVLQEVISAGPFQVSSGFRWSFHIFECFPVSIQLERRSIQVVKGPRKKDFQQHSFPAPRYSHTPCGLKPFGSVPDRSRTLPLFTELTLPLNRHLSDLVCFLSSRKRGEVQRHSDVH